MSAMLCFLPTTRYYFQPSSFLPSSFYYAWFIGFRFDATRPIFARLPSPSITAFHSITPPPIFIFIIITLRAVERGPVLPYAHIIYMRYMLPVIRHIQDIIFTPLSVYSFTLPR